ncbi:unnamed protein product [Meganyctiphanes norvegica]|uniref:Methyltransferase-like protein 22 n=1 Tax=Meganyctiphanes norvegica TaxID=48144 RepID=A0AAV2PX71_MEGNR
MSSVEGVECEPPKWGTQPSTVTSEVHFSSKDEKLKDQPIHKDGTDRGESYAVLTTFDFSYPDHLSPQVNEETCKKPMVDADGDLNVIRKNDNSKNDGVILIEHQSSSSLELVGEQVWRGAIFLGDFILHNPQIFKGCNVLELASGVGMTSVVAAMMAKQVVITDVDKGDILDMVHRNLDRNKEKIIADVKVKELDFFNLETIEDLIEDIHKTTVSIAADVVYHNQLTDGFFNAVLRILSEPPDKTLYVALEKRFVFTVEDLETCCPMYDYFVSQLNGLWKHNQDSISWTVEQVDSESFPQYFAHKRTKHLVLWKIQARLKI